MKRTVSKATVKRLLKREGTLKLTGGKVELLAFLDYIMFMKRLAAEADAKAHEEKQTTLQSDHIKAVQKNVLKKSSG